MEYIATYSKGKIFSENFEDIESIEEFNKVNNIKNHNLHLKCTLDEIINNGLIVCIEGDKDLEDRELSKELKKYDNFLMLNNIYNEPNKLAQLKDVEVDVLVVQSTGVRKEEIAHLQKQYIEHIGIFPKSIICVLGDEDEFLYPLIESSPHEINIYDKPYVDSKNKIVLSQWIGTEKQEKLLKKQKAQN